MGPVRLLILAVALTAAIGAAVLVRGMAAGQSATVVASAPVAPAPVQQPMTDVLIAKRDLPPGTVLVEADMGWQSWPEQSLNELFITKASKPETEGENVLVKAAGQAAEAAKEAVVGPEAVVADLVGTVVREPILAGEPMSRRKLVRAGSAGLMAITLTPGMRAVAVSLSAESAAGGFILPGDHVDVVQSRQVDAPGAPSGKRFLSETVLRNAKVLAIDQATGSEEAAVIGATATLELSPAQAEGLVLAKSEGELTLVLRSYADNEGPTVAVSPDQTDAAAFNSAAVVRVFRNGQPTEVQVSR